MFEREGIQGVGALQDVRLELSKLRGTLFFKVVEDSHSHLYNKGEYSSSSTIINEKDDDIPTLAASGSSHRGSRWTRTMWWNDNHIDSLQAADGQHKPGSVDESSSFDGREDESTLAGDNPDGGASDGLSTWVGINGTEAISKEFRSMNRRIPRWLSSSMPNEWDLKKFDSKLAAGVEDDNSSTGKEYNAKTNDEMLNNPWKGKSADLHGDHYNSDDLPVRGGKSEIARGRLPGGQRNINIRQFGSRINRSSSIGGNSNDFSDLGLLCKDDNDSDVDYKQKRTVSGRSNSRSAGECALYGRSQKFKNWVDKDEDYMVDLMNSLQRKNQ